MPSLYTKKMMPTLASRLEEFRTDPAMIQLREEIALARAFLAEQVDMACVVMAQSNADDGMRIAAMQLVRSATDHVADLVAKQATIEQRSGGSAPLEQLGFFIEQIARVIHKRVGDGELAQQLTNDFKTQLKLPSPETDPCVRIEFE